MIHFFSNIVLGTRFYAYFGLIAVLFAFAYKFEGLYVIALYLLLIGLLATIAELAFLFFKKMPFSAVRTLANKLSLGDDNEVILTIQNNTRLIWSFMVIDELPYQLQERNFALYTTLLPKKVVDLRYSIHPVKRGNYDFGDILLFTGTILNFIKRRVRVPAHTVVPVYPSIIQMKKFEILSLPNAMRHYGIKKVRRIGHSYEFEQIKNYNIGDGIRNINWKASAKANGLMINQFEEERSQQIYCIIDKSRVMKMPFNDLSLLDYAINASLVISNTALNKRDRAGLISYAETIDSRIKADNKNGQLNRILKSLYNEKQSIGEANYELLYHGIRSIVKTRSLLFLFTNFESLYSLKRVLNLLRRLNRSHLLVVIFFENSELKKYTEEDSPDLKEVYYKTAAQEFIHDKEQIALELRKHKIQTIYTKPEDLSINVLNKYLELKARGAI